MARYLKTVTLIVVLCFGLTSVLGCETLKQRAKEHPTAAGAAAGGVIGGAVGGTIGGLVGGDTKSALIGAAAGALVGGLAGGLIGHYKAKKLKGAEETIKDETAQGKMSKAEAASYQAPKAQPASATQPAAPAPAPAEPKGTYVRLKTIEIEPSPVGPGDTVKINFIYALLTPDPKGKAMVEESRSILFNGEEVGTVTFAKEHANGTWKSTVPLALPSQAEAGTYTVKGSLKAGEEVAAEQTTFLVQKKM